MFVVKRNGAFVDRADTITDAEGIVCDSGEVMEAAWERIVPLSATDMGSVVWQHNGWTVERVGL